MIDPYVIFAMPFNFISSINLLFLLSKHPVFIIAMRPNMVLVTYDIPCRPSLSYDFLTN